jgi:hypothetical protein
MNRAPKCLLLVEGDEDKRVLPWLIERAGVNWGPKSEPIVTIIANDGVEPLLTAGVIETYFKQSGLLALGVIVDADENAVARWQSISARIGGFFADVPQVIPSDGLILRGDTGPAFGAWIMPDNSSRGMLETFLLFLRPAENLALHVLSHDVVEQAKQLGAPFSLAHQDKAQIHSWLAWQDPPGTQLHNAVMQGMLREVSPSLTTFVRWFCTLYGLPRP